MRSNKYKSFDELSRHEEKDLNYRILCQDRNSPCCVVAIHGGWIEPGTSEIARALAGNDLSLYLFEGTKKFGNWDLHLGSPQFDEPAAVALTEKSKICISIHGFIEDRKHTICLGGLNEKLKAIVLARVLDTGLIEQTESNPCNDFFGISGSNIANRSAENGIQIEISRKLRDALIADPQKMALFVSAIRAAIFEYAPPAQKTTLNPPKPA